MIRRRTFRALLAAFAVLAASAAVTASKAADPPRLPCDPLDKALCLLPFPNNRFTRPDPDTDTGRRIDFRVEEMPRSVAGKPIDPTEWNRNDGFSPGSMAITFVPGLDLHRTWGTHAISNGKAVDPADHVSDIGRYRAADAPIVIIDTATGERWPFWSELDRNAQTAADERLLILRPAKNFLEGHRYVVALRNMKDAQGNEIPASPHFAAYRDGKPGPLGDPTFEESRRAGIDGLIAGVANAEQARGNAFDRSDLYLVWDFTIASRRNLSERVLHIRDRSFAQLGDTDLDDGIIEGDAPKFTITKVTETPSDSRKLREVEGTVTVPYYIDRPPFPPTDTVQTATGQQMPSTGLPGQAVPTGRFLYGLDGKPMQNPAMPTIEAPFICTIPRAATVSTPAHPMLYGHGLLGSRYESRGGSSDRMRERNFMPCAVNWFGIAEYDVANAVVTLLDPSNMPSMMDRTQQGFLNFLMLGRLAAHPQGLASHAAFKDGSGTPLIRTNELVYDGNSQGGILGGALAALGVDHTRSVLGVPGMNYSTLLNRSIDWEGELVNMENGRPGLPAYSSVLYTMFPDKQEQQLVMAVLQMLWDRGEANGYAQHMTDDPLPNTPQHRVMLHVAFGDFQVTNVAAEVEARTIGARVMDTALLPGRHWEAAPYFGLEPMPRDANGNVAAYAGSAIVYWDSGNLTPPNANVPPLHDGGDPHEDPRRDPRSGDQRMRFFKTGEVVDVMNGGAYLLCRPGQEQNIPRVPSLFTFDWCV